MTIPSFPPLSGLLRYCRGLLAFGLFGAALMASGNTARASEEFSSLPKAIQSRLLRGEVVLLSRRPGEGAEVDKRFVTMAKLMTGNRSEIWTVINDKDNSEKFLDGVLESRIVEEKGNMRIVEQRTRVGGPQGSYGYTLRHILTPESRVEFSFIKGEIKDVEGAWWIFDGPDGKRQFVVYALHIDPGIFAPQFLVKKGMKKTIPETLISTEKEVLRRRKAASN